MKLELTKRQAEIFDEVMAKVEETAAFLAGLSHEERLDCSQFPEEGETAAVREERAV